MSQEVRFALGMGVHRCGGWPSDESTEPLESEIEIIGAPHAHGDSSEAQAAVKQVLSALRNNICAG